MVRAIYPQSLKKFFYRLFRSPHDILGPSERRQGKVLTDETMAELLEKFDLNRNGSFDEVGVNITI